LVDQQRPQRRRRRSLRVERKCQLLLAYPAFVYKNLPEQAIPRTISRMPRFSDF
jgi:hypothetical protein